MKFCPRCGAQYSEGSRFCKQCGAQLPPSAVSPVSTRPPVVGGRGGLHCSNPNCKSTVLTPIVETATNTTTSGGGYSGAKGCLGYLLFGPCGLLCGNCGNSRTTTTQSTNRTYWVCQQCGNKFRNLQDLEKELEGVKKKTKMLPVAAVALAIPVIFLWWFINHENAPSEAVAVSGVVTALVIAMLVVLTIVQYTQTKRLTQERDALMRRCFD